jgi:hypothetical protein
MDGTTDVGSSSAWRYVMDATVWIELLIVVLRIVSAGLAG